MKNVIVIRHVKSDWSNLLSDFDRPVREDKKEDALLIAGEILKNANTPQYIITSPAIRALQTARLLCVRWGYPPEHIAADRSLYECSAKTIMAVIRKADDRYDTIAIVCHNPAITDFVNLYSDTYIVNVPTTGAVQIAFDVANWKSINGNGKTNWLLRPKELRG